MIAPNTDAVHDSPGEHSSERMTEFVDEGREQPEIPPACSWNAQERRSHKQPDQEEW